MGSAEDRVATGRGQLAERKVEVQWPASGRENFVESANHRMRGRFGLPVAGPERECGVHVRRSRGIKLGSNIGQEKDLPRRVPESGGDFLVAGEFAFGPGRCVEISFDVGGEIAGRGVSEEKLLR